MTKLSETKGKSLPRQIVYGIYWGAVLSSLFIGSFKVALHHRQILNSSLEFIKSISTDVAILVLRTFLLWVGATVVSLGILYLLAYAVSYLSKLYRWSSNIGPE